MAVENNLSHGDLVAVPAKQFARRYFKPSGLALLLCIASAVFDIPVTVSGIAIPTILPALIFLFAFKYGAIAFRAVPYVFGWLVLVTVSEFFSPAATTPNLWKFVAQSIFSIYCCVAAHAIVRKHSAVEVFKWATRLIWLLLLIGVLERFTPIGSSMRDFSSLLYSSESGYKFYASEGNLERDLALAGAQRVTMFMAEPSLAAIAVVTLLVLRMITSARRTLVVHGLILALAYFLIRSPILVLGLVSQFLFSATKSGLGRSEIVRLILAGAFSAGIVFLLFGNRLQYFDLNASYVTSEALRLLLPALLLFNTIDRGLFFGIGPSGLYDQDLIWALSGGYIDNIGTNALIGLFICFGVILPLIFFGILVARGSRSHRQFVPCLAFVALISMTLGAFMAPKLWLIAGVVLGALAVRTSN